MDVLASINTMVFNKTGTLTKGEFEVVSVHPNEIDETQLLHIASHVERSSKHPIAVALANAYHPKCDECEVSDVEEIAGQGIRAKVEGKIVCVGNAKMMDAIGVEYPTEKKSGTIVHISIDNRYAGHVVVADKVKPDARETINQLSQQGVENITMLTGDNDAVAVSANKQNGAIYILFMSGLNGAFGHATSTCVMPRMGKAHNRCL